MSDVGMALAIDKILHLFKFNSDYLHFLVFIQCFQPFLKLALVFTCLLYKTFENTVGKGEIAHNEQFLLFPTVFSTRLESFLPFS